VGAAKRKAKIPRIVKLKPLETAIKEVPSEEDNDANFDANNDTVDNSDNDDNDNYDDGDDDECDGDNDDDDMKKKPEGSAEEKGTTSETSHQPAIFRYEYLYFICGSVVSGLDDQGVRVQVPVGSIISTLPCCPDWLWDPPNLLSNGYQGLPPPPRGRE
jgi:hypothetical protein